MASGVGKNIVVTGANRGIGLALMEELVKNYDVKNVFATCREPEKAEDLKSLQNQYPSIKILALDVQNDESIKSAKEEVEKLLNGENLNTLINNAGIALNAFGPDNGGRFEAPSRDYYNQHFDTNITGVVMVTSAFLPLLKKAAADEERALIINISSSMASIAIGSVFKLDPTGNLAYSLTKASLNHYSRLIGRYLQKDGVIVASIAPGWTATDMGLQLKGSSFKVDPKYNQDRPLEPREAAEPLLKTASKLTLENPGAYMNRFGEILPD